MKQENIWKSYTEQQCRELEELSGRYKAFLDKGKTERGVRKGSRSPGPGSGV